MHICFPGRGGAVSGKTAVALGCFDGVHLGHRELFRVLKANAGELETAVWTFAPSESGESTVKTRTEICPFDEKLRLCEAEGISSAFIFDFETVRTMTPRQFVRDVLCGMCRASLAVCGYNYTFGRGATGTPGMLEDLMREFGGRAIVMPEFRYRGMPVSSTLIRNLLLSGKVEEASELLGRDYSLRLPVTHGRNVGHSLGYPTINQEFPDGMLIPRHGVYASRVIAGGKEYTSISNVGVHPTFGNADRANCETYIIGADFDLYGETVETVFKSFIRDEKKFASSDELTGQIAQDIKKVLDGR